MAPFLTCSKCTFAIWMVKLTPCCPPFEAIESGNECGRTFFHSRCIEKPTMAHLDEARQRDSLRDWETKTILEDYEKKQELV